MKLLTAITAAALLMASPVLADEDKSPIPTMGINHIGLTVKDLAASTAFFTDLLGWKKAGGIADYPANFVSDGNSFVTLWQATDPATATPFNRKTNVGLHHLAFTVPDVETLNEVYAKLKDAPGVIIEFAPELLGKGPTMHMMTYEPSGNRIEFIAPGGKHRTKSDG